MNYSKKINQIIKYYNLTPLKFSNIMKIQRSNLSHINSGRNKPSIDFLEKLHYYFPNISIDWFVTGEGTMLKTQTKLDYINKINNESKHKNIISKKNNKLLHITNYIKNVNIINNSINKIFLPKIIKVICCYSDNTCEVFINNIK